MSAEGKILKKLVSVLSELERESEDGPGYTVDTSAEEAWSMGVDYTVDTITRKLGITKDALTGEYKFDI